MAELGTCPVTLDGIGSGGCIQEAVLKMITGFIPEIESHSYATLSAFDTEATNLAAIVAKDILPLVGFEEIENTSTEALTSETSVGTKLFHRNGRYGFKGKMLLSPDQNRILQSYNFNVKRGYLMDDLGNRLGTSVDGTTVTGLTVSYFNVMPMELPLSADGSAWSSIEVQFEFVDEVNKTPRYSIASGLDWSPKNVIKPLTKITLTPSVVATNSFTCAFAYVDPTTGNSVPLTSLDANGAELTVLDEAGDAVVVTVTATATEGTYTITGTLASGSITLNALTTSLYYSDTTTLLAA